MAGLSMPNFGTVGDELSGINPYSPPGTTPPGSHGNFLDTIMNGVNSITGKLELPTVHTEVSANKKQLLEIIAALAGVVVIIGFFQSKRR